MHQLRRARCSGQTQRTLYKLSVWPFHLFWITRRVRSYKKFISCWTHRGKLRDDQRRKWGTGTWLLLLKEMAVSESPFSLLDQHICYRNLHLCSKRQKSSNFHNICFQSNTHQNSPVRCDCGPIYLEEKKAFRLSAPNITWHSQWDFLPKYQPCFPEQDYINLLARMEHITCFWEYEEIPGSASRTVFGSAVALAYQTVSSFKRLADHAHCRLS